MRRWLDPILEGGVYGLAGLLSVALEALQHDGHLLLAEDHTAAQHACANIDPRQVLDLLENGKARRFTYVMAAKSVITNPSPQAPLKHKKGFTVISGIAWSGRGKIARVDVSLDDGRAD